MQINHDDGAVRLRPRPVKSVDPRSAARPGDFLLAVTDRWPPMGREWHVANLTLTTSAVGILRSVFCKAAT